MGQCWRGREGPVRRQPRPMNAHSLLPNLKGQLLWDTDDHRGKFYRLNIWPILINSISTTNKNIASNIVPLSIYLENKGKNTTGHYLDRIKGKKGQYQKGDRGGSNKGPSDIRLFCPFCQQGGLDLFNSSYESMHVHLTWEILKTYDSSLFRGI